MSLWWTKLKSFVGFLLLTLKMFFLTKWKLICGEYKLWKQLPKSFVRLNKTLPKLKIICGLLFVTASFRPAILLTMKSFIGLSQRLWWILKFLIIYRRSEEHFILQNASQWLLPKLGANHEVCLLPLLFRFSIPVFIFPFDF